MASPVENQVEDATVVEEEEGHILEYLSQHGSTFTAKMLVELPLCRHNEIGTLASCVTRLKNKRAKLVTQRSNKDWYWPRIRPCYQLEHY